MNDTTYLLDESLTKLTDIRNLEIEMASSAYAAQSEQAKQEKEAALAQAERIATSCMSLGNETVHMMAMLTVETEITDGFMENFIVDRFAAMLDYNLAALVGPRCMDLKVFSLFANALL